MLSQVKAVSPLGMMKFEEDIPLLLLCSGDCVGGKCSTTEPPLCFLNFETGCHEVVYVGLEFIR